jgi:RNA polymerase sigma factor (sigma-70 family)
MAATGPIARLMLSMELTEEGTLPLSEVVVGRLVENHRQFLSFLEARVSSRAAAEEILQAAFVRALEKGDSIENEGSAVAWFYRVLRNAIIDHYRRTASEGRAMETHARDVEGSFDLELEEAICECVGRLLPTLKPEYADMIRKVDLQDSPLSAVASELSITTNNAAVRLHRARQALKTSLERSCGTCATHGCLDCTCSPSGHGCS